MGKGTGFFIPRYDVKPSADGASASANVGVKDSPEHVVHVQGSAGHATRSGLPAQDTSRGKPLQRTSVPACTSQWQLEGSSPPTKSRSFTSHRSVGRHSFPAGRTNSATAAVPASSTGFSGFSTTAAHSHASRACSWQSSMSQTAGTLSDQLLTCSSIADSHSLLAKNGAVVTAETCVSSWDEQHASWAVPATSFSSSNSSSCETPAVRSLMPAALQSAHGISPGSAAGAAAAAAGGGGAVFTAALQPLVDSDSSNNSLGGFFSAGQLSLLSQLPPASQPVSQGVKEDASSLCTALDMIILVTASCMDPALHSTWQLSPRAQQGANHTHLQLQQQQQQSAAGSDGATLDALLQPSAQLAAAKVGCGGVGVAGSPVGSLPVELSPNSSSGFNSDLVLATPYGLSWQQQVPASPTFRDSNLSPMRLRLLPLQQQLSGQQQLVDTGSLLSGELCGYGACAAPTPINQQLSLQAPTFATLDTMDHTSASFNTLVGSHSDMATLNTQQVTLASGQYAVSPGFSPDVIAAAAPGGQCGVGSDMAAVAAAVAHDKLAQMQRLEALQAQLRHEVAGLLTLI